MYGPVLPASWHVKVPPPVYQPPETLRAASSSSSSLQTPEKQKNHTNFVGTDDFSQRRQSSIHSGSVVLNLPAPTSPDRYSEPARSDVPLKSVLAIEAEIEKLKKSKFMGCCSTTFHAEHVKGFAIPAAVLGVASLALAALSIALFTRPDHRQSAAEWAAPVTSVVCLFVATLTAATAIKGHRLNKLEAQRVEAEKRENPPLADLV